MTELSNTLSYLSDAIWSFDLVNQKFLYINQSFANIYEVNLDAITSNPAIWINSVHPDDRQYVLTETKWALRGKEVNLEYRLLINGKIKWLNDKRRVILENGKIAIATGILSDITASKKVMSNLSDNEITFRYLFINNPNPLFIYELSSLKFLAVNHAAIAKYGYSKEEFLAMTIADIRPHEDIPSLREAVRKVSKKDFLSNNKVWRHCKKNQEIMYVNISGHGIRYQKKDAELVLVHDITNQINNNQETTIAKENLDALINNLDDQIWSLDLNYRILSANIPFKKVFKQIFNKEVQIGENILLNKQSAFNWKEYYDKALNGNSFQVIELINVLNTEPYFAEIKFSPITLGTKIIGVACIARNIQERLEDQKRMLEQNNRLLELIAIASHEIRGPVVSMLGLTNIFNHDNLSDPFNAELIQLVQNQALNLDKLIHTLVDKTYALQQSNTIKRSSLQNQ